MAFIEYREYGVDRMAVCRISFDCSLSAVIRPRRARRLRQLQLTYLPICALTLSLTDVLRHAPATA